MKKRFLCLLMVIATLLMVTASAVEARTADAFPYISFNGTTATCTVTVSGDHMQDEISITMTLKRGNTVIDTWSTTGNGIVKMAETATVELNKTYTLVVDFTVNGVEKPAATITRTNN